MSETTCGRAVGLGKWMCYVFCSSRGGCRLLCLLCCEGSKQVCIFLVCTMLCMYSTLLEMHPTASGQGSCPGGGGGIAWGG